MSVWAARPAACEPLCAPSTSYSATNVSQCRSRVAGSGLASRRGRRELQHICTQATQAAQSFHNTYKLIHQPSRKADTDAPPTAPAAPAEVKQPAGRQQRGRRGQKAAKQPPPTVSNAVLDGVHAATDSGPSTSAALPTAPASADARLGTSPDALLSFLTSPDFGGAPRAPRTTPADVYSPSSSNSRSAHGRTHNGTDTDARPYRRHSVSLSEWQPPATSLQHGTALTRALMACASYTRLHQLLLDNASDFNPYHTCAALNRALALQRAGLSPREARLFKEGCSTLQNILRRQLPDLQPRSVVVAAYSLARLELPDRELLAGLAGAVEPQLHTLQPRGLASLLWAFAKQGHQPPPKWMDAFLSCCAAELSGWAPRDVSTLMWALARLHFKVAPARLKQLLDHTQSQMSDFCGRSLSNVVYSLALSQQHPGEEWLRAAQARAVALGPATFSPQGMTQMAWGLAKLGSPPSPALVALVAAHVTARLPRDFDDRQRQIQRQSGGGPQDRKQGQPTRDLPRYTGLDLSTLLYSLGSWGAQPRPELGRRLLLALEWEMPVLEPNQMCNCLWACARLRLYPNRSWLRDFYDASYRQLPYFKPVDLAQSLWALARLEVSPPEAWLSAALTRLQHTASMFSPVEVANTMWALAKMGVRGDRMPAEVLALFFIATDKRLSSFKTQELCSMIWALAQMRRRPDKEWSAEFLKVTYHKLGSMGGWCLATLAWSLAELSLQPPPAWIYSFVNATRALAELPEHRPPAVASAAEQHQLQHQPQSHLRQPGAEAPLRSVREAAAAGQGAGVGLSAMDLGQIITSLRRLNSGGLAKVEDYVRDAEEQLRQMEAGSGAYAAQQVGHFLTMSPRQAGMGVGGAADATAVNAPTEPDLSGSDDETAGARAGSDEEEGRARQEQLRRASVEQQQVMEEQQPKQQQPKQRRRSRAVALPSAVAPPMSAEARPVMQVPADTVPSRDLTRVLRSGARVTVLSPPPEVHLEVGELAVGLPSLSGPVSLRAPAAAGNGNGSGNSGDGSVASAAEIRERLLAV